MDVGSIGSKHDRSEAGAVVPKGEPGRFAQTTKYFSRSIPLP